MLIKPFSKDFNAEKIFAIQNKQYRDTLLLADTVPAGTSKIGKVHISNLGHFFSMFITGSFESVGNPAGAIVDTGLSYLSGLLSDGTGSRKLFSDRIPLDLWLSPGRRKSATSTTVLADPIGSTLFYPIEFEYLWAQNGDIVLDVLNTSNVPVSYEIAWHGIRIVTSQCSPK
jgi:hypothetical protein